MLPGLERLPVSLDPIALDAARLPMRTALEPQGGDEDRRLVPPQGANHQPNEQRLCYAAAVQPELPVKKLAARRHCGMALLGLALIGCPLDLQSNITIFLSY